MVLIDPYKTSDNVEQIFVTISWANHWFRVFIKRHFSDNSFFVEIICEKYFLHLPSENGIPWRNQQTTVLLGGFCMNSLDDSTDCHNLWCCESISPKTVLIFPANFLNFRFNTVEKQNKILLSSNRSKSSASVVLDHSAVNFFEKGKMKRFVHFSIWHLAEWMGHPMKLELTCEGLLVWLANQFTTLGALLYCIYFYRGKKNTKENTPCEYCQVTLNSRICKLFTLLQKVFGESQNHLTEIKEKMSVNHFYCVWQFTTC